MNHYASMTALFLALAVSCGIARHLGLRYVRRIKEKYAGVEKGKTVAEIETDVSTFPVIAMGAFAIVALIYLIRWHYGA